MKNFDKNGESESKLSGRKFLAEKNGEGKELKDPRNGKKREEEKQ